MENRLLLLFNHEICKKVPHIESNSNTAASALDREHRSKCSLYQARLKDYHYTKQHAAPQNFKSGDIVYCTNTKPNKLDSKFSLAKHVIAFGLVNVNTGTTLVRNAKYLKHVPSEYVSNHTEWEVGTETKESNDCNESGVTVSDACDNNKKLSPLGQVMTIVLI